MLEEGQSPGEAFVAAVREPTLRAPGRMMAKVDADQVLTDLEWVAF